LSLIERVRSKEVGNLNSKSSMKKLKHIALKRSTI